MPVTLPPGRARFVTKPVATGSPTSTMTIGTVFVAEMAARHPQAADFREHVQQLFGEGGEPVELAVGEPSFNDDVSSVFPAEVTEALAEGIPRGSARLAGLGSQQPDAIDLPRLLRFAHNWRRQCRKRQSADECAAVYH